MRNRRMTKDQLGKHLAFAYKAIICRRCEHSLDTFDAVGMDLLLIHGGYPLSCPCCCSEYSISELNGVLR